MARSTSARNIKVEPANPVWGNQERACIEVLGDVAGSLSGTHFTFQGVDKDGLTTNYYAWFNTGASVDPAVAGATGVEVVIAEGASALVVRDALVLALNGLAQFNAGADQQDGKILAILECKEQGEVLPATDVNTTFVITQEAAGSKLALGLTEDIEVAIAEDLLDIQSSQTGNEILARLRLGNSAGPISIPMKESDAAKLKEILKVGGEAFTPAAGTEVVGWGSSKSFTNVIPDSKKLVLHPTRLPEDNRADDFAFWLAYPNLNSINFSGSSEQIVTVEFTIYKDEARDNRASLFVRGDHTQNLLK